MTEKGSFCYIITHYLNVDRVKAVALLVVSGLVLYQSMLYLEHDSHEDTCTSLLTDGRFLSDNTWQPYGCRMHNYSKSEARTCMAYMSKSGEKTYIAFVGDSRIRQLYFEFVSLVSAQEIEKYKAHSDILFNDRKIATRIDFFWCPMVNGSIYKIFKNWRMNLKNAFPNLIISGSGTWSIKLNNGSREALNNYKVNLTLLRSIFKRVKDTTKVLWMLQDPVVEDKFDANRSVISNERIDEYNEVAIDVFDESEFKIWKSSRLVAHEKRKESEDGLHISKSALDLDVQILLNMYCNEDMNHRDGTCCNKRNTLQLSSAVFLLSCIVILIACCLYQNQKLIQSKIRLIRNTGTKLWSQALNVEMIETKDINVQGI